MTDDNQLSFNLPSVSRKKVTAAFDGGRLSSDAGVMLLALAERCRKVADTLAAHIADQRDPLHITHTVADVLRARMLAIGCGYPDGNDFDWLRRDAAFKLACGRLPDTGRDLCSQPTISRWENAPTLREIIRLTYALVDIWCGSYQKPPPSVVLDIDDTVDVVHGHQQLAQWNAHYDERCFLPIHVYDAATGAPVTVILRPGKTPSGVEVRKLLSRLIGRIRRHWPNTCITIRGDGHYGREEAMTWCENYGIDYIFGLSPTLCTRMHDLKASFCEARTKGTERRKIFRDKADGLGRRGKATIVTPRGRRSFGPWPFGVRDENAARPVHHVYWSRWLSSRAALCSSSNSSLLAMTRVTRI